jgi:hypothetical protein
MSPQQEAATAEAAQPSHALELLSRCPVTVAALSNFGSGANIRLLTGSHLRITTSVADGYGASLYGGTEKWCCSRLGCDRPE